MQHDAVIWNVINQNFCAYKVKTVQQAFCRHKYNVTGLCNRRSCPLANSNYATVREHKGRIYLCIKTIERAHSPKNMWERIKLKQNFKEALKQIDEHLAYWPSWLKLRCKQRLTRITQYLIRMRKLALKPQRELIPRKKKIERRESRREVKALRAAHINTVIENELLERLKQGTYEGVYNFPENAFNNVMDQEGEHDEDPTQDEEEKPEVDVMEADEFVPEYEEEDEETAAKDMEEFDMEEGLDELFAEMDDDDDSDDAQDDDDEDDAEAADDDDDDDDDEASKSAKRAATAQDERKQALASAAALLLRRKARSRVSIEYEKEAEAAASSSKTTNW